MTKGTEIQLERLNDNIEDLKDIMEIIADEMDDFKMTAQLLSTIMIAEKLAKERPDLEVKLKNMIQQMGDAMLMAMEEDYMEEDEEDKDD